MTRKRRSRLKQAAEPVFDPGVVVRRVGDMVGRRTLSYHQLGMVAYLRGYYDAALERTGSSRI